MNNGKWKCIDWTTVAFSTTDGAVVGGLTPFVGTSVVGAVGLNGLVSMGTYAAQQTYTGGVGSITAEEIIANGFFGGVDGLVGGLPRGWTPVREPNPFVNTFRNLFRKPIPDSARFWDRQFNFFDELDNLKAWPVTKWFAGSAYTVANTSSPNMDCPICK